MVWNPPVVVWVREPAGQEHWTPCCNLPEVLVLPLLANPDSTDPRLRGARGWQRIRGPGAAKVDKLCGFRFPKSKCFDQGRSNPFCPRSARPWVDRLRAGMRRRTFPA